MSRGDHYIPGFDGVRACAALAVMAIHAQMPGAALGWSGVNCFFVLSGFLITGILLQSKGNADYFSGFYLRRALRIFPAYYLLICALLVIGLVTARPTSDAFYYFVYVQNFAQAIIGEQLIAFPQSATHTWTLAVEEQFYLLWPLAVAVLSPAALRRLIVSLICLGPLARIAVGLISSDWVAPYYLTPCEVDALAWGALAATWDWQRNRRTIERSARYCLAGAATVLAAAACYLGYDRLGSGALQNAGSIPGSLFFSLLGISYLALLIVAQSGGTLTRLLEWSPLRYLGRISYGLYLYHLPLFWTVNHVFLNWPFWSSVAIKFGGTTLLAAISYRFLERPLMGLRHRGNAQPTISLVAADSQNQL